jgi:hypothetical protein
MAIVPKELAADIISKAGFTYQNLWTPTGEPFDYTFHVDRAVFDAVLQRVRAINNDADLAALARTVDITTSLVPNMMEQAKAYHFSMNLLHAGAVFAIVVSMLRILTTPNPSPEELNAMCAQR